MRDRSSLCERLAKLTLLGFVSRDGAASRTGTAKVGSEILIQGISTAFTIIPNPFGTYTLFPNATVNTAGAPNELVSVTISISALPTGTQFTDTSTGNIGALSGGTDRLSESVNANNLAASLTGMRLVFQNGATVPGSVAVTFSMNDQFNDIQGLPNQGNSYNPATGSATATLTACFAAGTRIAAVAGDIAVEQLCAGDTVFARFGGMVPVRWTGHRRVDCTRHPHQADVWPVRVRASAFAPGLPRRDLILSPDHALYVDAHLVPVRYLLNGATVVQERWESVTYWHVELPMHDVLEAEGLAAESYLDTGNRGAFVESDGAVHLTPDFARSVWTAEGCARLAVSGPLVERVRAMLWLRALELGHGRTSDPNLEVWADGIRLAATAARGGLRVQVPAGAGQVELRSRRTVPLQESAVDDGRTLGVPVAALSLDGVPIQLDSGRLRSGWHAPEDGWRWTNGAAVLLPRGARVLDLALAPISISYWNAAEKCRAAA